MRWRILWALEALVILVALVWIAEKMSGPAPRAYDTPREKAAIEGGGPIALESTRGEFSLTQLAPDEVAVVSFGYTSCPDVCPVTQAVTRQALSRLTEDQRARVVPLLISVDPERDSIERLQEYMGHFGERFVGATGSKDELEDIAERYGVVWRRNEAPNSAMGYTIDHSAGLFVVNREGDILERVIYSNQADALVEALEAALKRQA